MAQRDCIKAMREAVGEDRMSEAEAKKIFERANNLSKARANAKKISIDQAFREIAGELKAEQRNLSALAVRNASLNAYKLHQIRQKATAGKNYGKGFRQVFESIRREMQSLDDRFRNGFEGQIKLAVGKDGEYALRTGKLDHAELFKTVDELQRGVPTTSKDKVAVSIAKAYEDFRKQMVSMTNREGGDIKTGPGFLFSRSYSRKRILALGDGDPIKGRKAFRALMESVNVDWERTYSGEDKDLFWRNVYDNFAHSEHASPNADLDAVPGSVFHGSVAKRASRPREIWFKDWQSEKAIFDALSNYRNPIDNIYGMIHNASRNIAIMRLAGPDGVNNLSKAQRQLHVLARDTGDVENSKSLETGMFDTMSKMLAGQTMDRQYGKLESIMRGLRAATNMMYSGNFLISNMPDLAFLDHRLTQIGLSRLESAAIAKDAAFGSYAPREKQYLWQAQFAIHDSIARSMVTNDGYHWTGDKIDKLQRQTYRLSLFDKWNRSLESASAEGLARVWALEAHKPFEKLSPGIRAIMSQEPGFSPAHWDAFRKSAWKFSDPEMRSQFKDFGISDEALDASTAKGAELHLTVDGVDRLPDEALKGLLGDKKPTAANYTRIRDELSGMVGRIKELFVDKALNRPDLRTRYWLGQGNAPGTTTRVLMDSILMYKSFIVQTSANIFDDVTQGNGWKGFGNYMRSYEGIKSTSRLIAATTIAGYLAMTAKDYLEGKTRRQLIAPDGTINGKVVMAAMVRGGGLGIMSNFLFDDYDRNLRTFSSTLIGGPVFGQLDPLFAAATESRRAYLSGDETAARDLRSNFGNYLNRLPVPYLNLWYTRPFMNYMVMWNLRDMLSPGVLQRQEERVGKQGYQAYWLSPGRAAQIPISEPGRKMQLLIDSLEQ